MSIVLVDMDGVLADTHFSWLQMYNRDWHDNLRTKDITRWALHEFVKPECGRRVYDYLERPEFYDFTPIIENALYGVNALRALGHRVIVVSAGFYQSKVLWLSNNGFLNEFPYKNDYRPFTALDLILCNDKSLIKGDYLIDDRLENVVQFTRNGIGILFTQPWNENRAIPNRANNWMDVIEYFKQI